MRPFRSVVGHVEVEVPPTHHDQVVTKGFSFNRTVTMADDADSVHLLLRDTPSDATGSLIIPVTVFRATAKP